nr:hypothetical protein [Tanacetum cinerariifolium]
MDLDVADVLPQPSTEQLDEGFTATAYSMVQENLKLTVEEHVLLEEPASSSRTLSSLQHLSKDISFGDLFFSDKPSDVDKNTETKVESMVNVSIQQDLSLISPMTSPIIDLTSRPESPKRIDELEHIMANLIQVNKEMEERLDKHGARLYTLERLDIPQQVSEAVKADMKEMIYQRMWETKSYKSHEDHMQLFEALEKSINRDHSDELAQDLAEARKKKKKSRESSKTPLGSPPHQPPPPPPLRAGPSGASRAPGASGSSQVPPPPPPPSSTNQESQSKGSVAPSSSNTAASAEYQAWTMTDIRLRKSISKTPADLEMDEDMGPDEQAQSSDDEDIRSAHIPKASTLVSNYSPPPEDSLLAQTDDIVIFMDWFYKRRGITELKPQNLEGPAFEIVKVFHPDLIHLQYQMEECRKLLTNSMDDPILRHNVNKPLPLGGPPEECKYDIAAMYGIFHWCFQRQRFYINRHTSEGDIKAVRTHMRILSVVRIEVFSMYGYDYMKKIVLRRADLNEHFIAERDFKYMYPSDFEYLYLLNLQGHLNHLLPKDKKILTTAVNQWTRHLDESRFKYEVLDQEGRGSEQSVHVSHSEAIEDKEDLLQPEELCWWTRQRGRLQTFEAYRMIKSFRHSRPL